MNIEIKKAVNKAINVIAEDYYSKTQYDEDGHAYDMSWEDCIDHARDDFMSDICGYMECYDVYPNEKEEQEINDYAWSGVTWKTIKEMA